MPPAAASPSTSTAAPVFARGANWIPADALPGRITDGEDPRPAPVRRRRQHEHDPRLGRRPLRARCFYEACDALGLLVWQDFMFACHLYPCDEDFLVEVEWEVRHPGRPHRPPRRALVRRQRAHRRAHLVRGVAPEPRPLPRRLRPAQPHDRDGAQATPKPPTGGPRAPPPGRCPSATPGTTTARATCTSGRSGTRAATSSTIATSAPLLLRVRLPVLHLAPRHPHLRRRGRPQHRLPGDGEPPEERRRQRPHRRDDVPLLPLPQGLRLLRLALPGPAGPRDQDRRRLLALAQAPLHGRPLLAAQRHLARRLLVVPRLRRQLEAPALHGETLLRPRHRLRHPRPTAASASPPSTTPPRPSPSPSPSAPPRWTAPPAPSRKPREVGTDAAAPVATLPLDALAEGEVLALSGPPPTAPPAATSSRPSAPRPSPSATQDRPHHPVEDGRLAPASRRSPRPLRHAGGRHPRPLLHQRRRRSSPASPPRSPSPPTDGDPAAVTLTTRDLYTSFA